MVTFLSASVPSSLADGAAVAVVEACRRSRVVPSQVQTNFKSLSFLCFVLVTFKSYIACYDCTAHAMSPSHHITHFVPRQKFGGRLKAMVSGGALLPPHIEKFFALTGLNVS